MVQNLPTHRFSLKDADDFTPEKIDKLVKRCKRRYLLEVDVEYPKELHENYNELPFLAERMKIGRLEKLVPDLKDKKGIHGTHQSTGARIKAWFKIKKAIPGY